MLGPMERIAFVVLVGAAITIPAQAYKVTCNIGVLYAAEDKALFSMMSGWVDEEKKNLTACTTLSLLGIQTESEDLFTPAVINKLGDSIFIIDISFGSQRASALGEVLKTPFLTLKPVFEDTPHRFLVSIRFSFEMYCRAIVDVLLSKVKGWNDERVAILFEETHYRFATELYSVAREKEIFDVSLMPELELGDEKETASALDVLKKLRPTHVVLICNPNQLQLILEKASRKGVINDDSKWIVADMDLPVEIGLQPALRGLVGLRLGLGQRAGDSNNTTGMIDRVLLNETLRAVMQTVQLVVVGKGWLIEIGRACALKQRFGEKSEDLLEMLGKTMFQDSEGRDFQFSLRAKSRVLRSVDIINIQEQEGGSKLKKVGNWTENGGVNWEEDPEWIGDYWVDQECKYRTPTKHTTIRRTRPGIRKLRVLTLIDEPFCIKKSSKEEGNDQYEGFSVDLLEKLSDRMNFNYTLDAQNMSYGAKINGEWTGLVGELTKEKSKVDIVIGAISITAEREKVIDFSKPIMDFRLALIMPKPKGEDVQLFAFLLPFDGIVWLCTIAAVAVVTLFMAFLDRFSPYGHRALALQSEDGEGENTFSLFNSLWFATGSILGQGPDNMPRSGSGRVLAASFWLFTLILISTYTANLAAYFTAKEVKSSIQSLDDLPKQTKITYGVLKGGSLFNFFQKSSSSPFREIYRNMEEWKTFMNTTKEGVERVQNDQDFAYMTDQPYLDYYNSKQPCNTMLLTNLLEGKSYGIGLRRHSDLTNDFSVAILKLREEGIVEKIRHRWWDSLTECPVETKKPGSTLALTLHHVAGVFITLTAGLLASLLLLLMESKCKRFMSFMMRVEEPSEEKQNDTDNRTNPAPQEMINNAEKRPKCNNRKHRRSNRADLLPGPESSDCSTEPGSFI